MATLLSSIETQARRHIIETTASFWTSAELIDIADKGIRDLWRDIVDLKQEHFLTINNTGVTLPADTSTLAGLPSDIHKVYLIEPLDTSGGSSNEGLVFKPLDYNHPLVQTARSNDAVDPSNDTLYYSVTGAGAPTGTSSTVIYIAPQVNSAVNINFVYVPTLGTLAATDKNPIPGESDNALIAWTVAFARAKEREDRSPDPNWISLYSTEKQHLLHSLGLRQLQEPSYADAIWQQYW